MPKFLSATATLQMDFTDKILLKHALNKNGNGQKFFTHEVRRLSDPYVPMRSGTLKNTAVEYVDKIVYVQPYARRQWYENKGNGLRGKEWCLRMWAARKHEIIASVQNYCRGKK